MFYVAAIWFDKSPRCARPGPQNRDGKVRPAHGKEYAAAVTEVNAGAADGETAAC